MKRRKELPFDNVIQRDKKLKLGRFRKALGLQRRRRFIALLRKFPGVFEIEEIRSDGGNLVLIVGTGGFGIQLQIKVNGKCTW